MHDPMETVASRCRGWGAVQYVLKSRRYTYIHTWNRREKVDFARTDWARLTIVDWWSHAENSIPLQDTISIWVSSISSREGGILKVMPWFTAVYILIPNRLYDTGRKGCDQENLDRNRLRLASMRSSALCKSWATIKWHLAYMYVYTYIHTYKVACYLTSHVSYVTTYVCTYICTYKAKQWFCQGCSSSFNKFDKGLPNLSRILPDKPTPASSTCINSCQLTYPWPRLPWQPG